MRRIRRFLALGASGQKLFLWSLALLPAIVVLTRSRGFAAARAFAGRVWVPAGGEVTPEAAAHFVDAAANLVGATCVPRSIVLWRLLRDLGPTIRFGVARPSSGEFFAHAWVEIDGRAVNDASGAVSRYAAFPANP